MRIINNALKVFLLIFGFCGLYFVKDMNLIISILITIPGLLLLALMPQIIKKIFNYKMSDKLTLIYLIFMILAFEIGSLYDFYQFVWWYDLFTHFLSGMFMSLIGVIILEENKISLKKNKLFYITFIISFSLMIAGLWEMGEYACDTFFGSNTQFVKETGVSDTMDDMIIATFGSIIYTGYYLLKRKNK